jgi:hypothetical protein
VGGFILNRLGFVPRGGESFEAEGYRFTVMEMDRRRVARVKIKVLSHPATPQSHDTDSSAVAEPADVLKSPKPPQATVESREK